jgi:pimeloyl-ACP methyl ester carboxylesterase
MKRRPGVSCSVAVPSEWRRQRKTVKDIDTSKTAVYGSAVTTTGRPSRTIARALADTIPGARYVRMANLGHFPIREDPERFKSNVGSVLAEIASVPQAVT